MTLEAPHKCPKCGCPTLAMQVIAWGLFRDGKFETYEIGGQISYFDGAIAVCDNEDCGHEWTWEQIP